MARGSVGVAPPEVSFAGSRRSFIGGVPCSGRVGGRASFACPGSGGDTGITSMLWRRPWSVRASAPRIPTACWYVSFPGRMSDAANGEKKEPLDVYQLIMAMTQEMASVAWQKMGLQPDMISGTIEKDLAQAKAAIDATTALGGVLEPRLDDEDRRRLHGLLRDLKINYVQHSGGEA